ncbi:hypothetical protein K469DRAFT_598487, partial [Zopfia rhizophila CBS 207.26]
IVWVSTGNTYADINGAGVTFDELSLDGIKWTKFRVPFLSDAGLNDRKVRLPQLLVCPTNRRSSYGSYGRVGKPS